MNILLTNDDGYQAQGIQALYRCLKEMGHNVRISAPAFEQSAKSHAMSFYAAVQVNRISDEIYAVSGTPADSVAIGLSQIFKNWPVDFVVSGINHGFNVGVDVNYSGTVGAATEAVLMGHKAIAVSMDTFDYNHEECLEGFLRTAKFVGNILKNTDQIQWPKMEVLNINAPMNPKGIKVADCTGQSLYVPNIQEISARKQKHMDIYMIGGLERVAPDDSSQDVSHVINGYATLSFVQAKQSSTESNKKIPNLFLDISI